MIFHIIGKDDWQSATDEGEYAPPGLTSEGFIHLSEKDQILRPANLLYAGRDDLVLLVINAEIVTHDVIHEPGSHGEAENFPHLYGPLNIEAVVDVVPFPCEPNGEFVLPAGLPD